MFAERHNTILLTHHEKSCSKMQHITYLQVLLAILKHLTLTYLVFVILLPAWTSVFLHISTHFQNTSLHLGSRIAQFYATLVGAECPV